MVEEEDGEEEGENSGEEEGEEAITPLGNGQRREGHRVAGLQFAIIGHVREQCSYFGFTNSLIANFLSVAMLYQLFACTLNTLHKVVCFPSHDSNNYT